MDQAIGRKREHKETLSKQLMLQKNEMEAQKSRARIDLQGLNAEHERMVNQYEYLS